MSFTKVIEANRNQRNRQAARPQQSAPTPAAPRVLTQGDALSRIQANQTSAGRLLAAGRNQMTPEEAAQIEAIAGSGVLANAGSGLASIFNWLDRPRKLMALGIRDLMGFDERRGTEITWGDYGAALKGENDKLVERLGEDVVGEGGNLGFSQLLDDVWEFDPENMAWWEKTARFGVSMAGDIGTDPLSYVTFGGAGVGKVAAKNAVEETITKAAARAAVRLSDDFGVTASKGARELAGEAVTSPQATRLEQTIMERARGNVKTKVDDFVKSDEIVEARKLLDDADYQDIVDDFTARTVAQEVGVDQAEKGLVVTGNLDEVSGRFTGTGSAGEILNDVAKRVTNRDFGRRAAGYDNEVWGAYLDEVFQHGGKAFTTGGMRLALPFAISKSSRPILQGSGRAINRKIGGFVGKSKTARRLGHRFEKAVAHLDAKKPGILLAREGKTVQANAIRAAGDRIGASLGRLGNKAMNSMDAVADQVRKEAGRAARGSQEAAESLMDDANRILVRGLQRQQLDAAELAKLPVNVQPAVKQAFEAISDTYNDAWGLLLKANPRLRQTEGYVPFYLDNQFANVMHSMISDNKMMSLPETLGEAKLLAADLGVEVEDLVRFVEVAGTIAPSLAKGGKLAWASEFNARTTGRTATPVPSDEVAEMLSFSDEVLLLQPALQDIDDMSRSLTTVLKAYVEKNSLPYKVNKVNHALDQDAGSQMAKYLGSVTEAAVQAEIVNAARSYGMVRNAKGVELLDTVAAQFAGEVSPVVMQYLEAIIEHADGAMASASKALHATKKVALGGGLSVEVPEALATHPGMVRALERARKAIRNAEALGEKAKHDRRLAAQRLRRENPSLSQSQADQLSSMTSQALTEFRVEAMEVARVFDEQVTSQLQRAGAVLSDRGEMLDDIADAKRSAKLFAEDVDQHLARLEADFEAKYATNPGNRQEHTLTVRNQDLPADPRAADQPAFGSVNVAETEKLIAATILDPIKAGVTTGLRVKSEKLIFDIKRALEKLNSGGDRAISVMGAPAPLAPQDRAMLTELVAAWNEELELYTRILSGRVTRAEGGETLKVILMHRSRQEGMSFHGVILTTMDEGYHVLRQTNPKYADRVWKKYLAWTEDPTIHDELLKDPDFNKLLAVGIAAQDGWGEDLAQMSHKQLDNWLRTARGKHGDSILEQANRLRTDFTDGFEGRALDQAQRFHNDWAGIMADAGMQEAPLYALARLYSDPNTFDVAVGGLDSINRMVRQYLHPDASVVIDVVDGVPIVRIHVDNVESVLELPAGAKSLSDVSEGLRAGRIAADQLQTDQVAAAGVFGQISDAADGYRDLAKGAGQSKAAVTRNTTKLAQLREVQGQFDDLVTGVLTGQYRAARLRNWVFRADGSYTPEMKRLVRLIGEGSANAPDNVRRLVDNLLASDAATSPVTKRVLAQNEGRHAKTMLRPVEQSLNDVTRVVDQLTTAAQNAATEDLAETYRNAAKFVEEMSGFADLVGVAVDDFGRPLTGGARASRYASADVKASREAVREAAKALGGPTKKEKELVAKIRDVLKGTDEAKIPNTPEGFATAEQLGFGGILTGTEIDEYLGLMFENMVNTTKAIHTPWGMQQLQDSASTVVRWWKSAATVSKPSFHVRNLISGIANGFLVGVGPNNYARVGGPLHSFRKLHQEMLDMDEIFVEMRKLHGDDVGDMFEAAWDQGVFQGFSRGEGLAFGGGRLPSTGSKLNPANPANIAFRTGGRVMESMEDLLRMAAFERHYAGPGTERLAAQMVIAVHFDYNNLTQLERKFKKIAPFFVWTRRNLPLQLQTLLERPGMINMWNHLQRNAEQTAGGPGMLPLSQYASPLATPVEGDPSQEGSPFWARMLWDPDLPVRILDEIPAFAVPDESGFVPVQLGSFPDWINRTAELLGPQFTLPLNIIRAEEYGDVEAPRGLNDIIMGVDAIVEAGGLDVVDTSSGAARIPRWLRSTVESAIPFMSEYRQMLGFVPADPSRAAREGYLPDDQDNFLAALLKGDVDNVASDLLRHGPNQTIMRGLGFNYQTPNDTRGSAFEAQEVVSDVRARLARAAGP